MKNAAFDTHNWQTAADNRGHWRLRHQKRKSYPHNWLRSGTTENNLKILHLLSPLFSLLGLLSHTDDAQHRIDQNFECTPSRQQLIYIGEMYLTLQKHNIHLYRSRLSKRLSWLLIHIINNTLYPIITRCWCTNYYG